jgi:transposase-like protein
VIPALIDTKTGEVIEILERGEARELTDRIRVGIEGIWECVIEAYEGRAWLSLGYSSWDDYCTSEFDTSRLRLPREERQEVVASLRDSGLSIRAIAAATGDSVGTVHAQLAGVQNRTPEPDDEIVELAPDAATTARAERPAEPPKVTGIDGKTYTGTRTPPRRTEEVADDAPVRQRTLAALARWDTCPSCKGAGRIRKEHRADPS